MLLQTRGGKTSSHFSKWYCKLAQNVAARITLETHCFLGSTHFHQHCLVHTPEKILSNFLCVDEPLLLHSFYTVFSQHFLLDSIDLARRVLDLLEMCGTFALNTAPDCCNMGLGFLNLANVANKFPSSCCGYYSELFPFTREPATFCITAFGILTIFNTICECDKHLFDYF